MAWLPGAHTDDVRAVRNRSLDCTCKIDLGAGADDTGVAGVVFEKRDQQAPAERCDSAEWSVRMLGEDDAGNMGSMFARC
jgi:hypothetical protein